MCLPPKLLLIRVTAFIIFGKNCYFFTPAWIYW